jgi:hypothetical protein
MDRLLRALEKATGRQLDDAPREKLKEWGVLEQDYEKRDQKIEPWPPKQEPRPAPMPEKNDPQFIKKQRVIAGMLRSNDKA